jgi:uracil-DNA glycosylase
MVVEKELILRDKLGDEWFELLKGEFETEYMSNLSANLKTARSRKIIYPEPQDLFKAFKLTPLSKVKVVWLGQDPYPNGYANGLAFDCSKLDGMSASWKKIMDVYDKEYPNHFATDLLEGDLTRWAEQGVFLLNVSLTVPKGEPGKHIKHWQPFTSKVLELLLDSKSPKVFVCLGSWAKGIAKYVVPPHGLAEYEHPAAASYKSRDWNADGIFQKINEFFEKERIDKIEW